MNDHLITTRPVINTCKKCGAHVLAATVGGLDCHAEPAALNPAGELAALTGGLATFELRAGRLARRTPDMITAGATGPVLAAHTCHPVPYRFLDCDDLAVPAFIAAHILGARPVADDTPPAF